MSQLSLAHAIGGSPRHVSFIESGRSRPGEGLVHRLADALGLPKRGRNALLRAAGFAPLYAEDALEGPALAEGRRLMSMILEKHRPHPGVVIDGGWVVRDANPAARSVFGADCVGRNSVALLSAMRDRLENFEEVVAGSRQRLVEERFANPDREDLDRLIEELDRLVPPSTLKDFGPAMSARYRVGDRTIEVVVTVARFGSASHLSLDELRVELVYPVNEEGEAFFRALDPGTQYENESSFVLPRKVQ